MLDASPASEIEAATTLAPLPSSLRHGLIAVSTLSLLSFISTGALLIHLTWRLITWNRCNNARINQFFILIYNLILADVQQSTAFALNIRWVLDNAIIAGTKTCWAQAWFASTGDLASGLFTMTIAIHSLADIVFDYRLSHRGFLLAIVGVWAFNYCCAIVGPAQHPSDFFVRAGAWCWINERYVNERLWLHYVWILSAEFLTLVIYGIIFLILQRRVRQAYYVSSETSTRARSAAKLIIAYPIVYMVCTLPIVLARLKMKAGKVPTFTELSVAGGMITSNGWLDVLLYSLTRRSVIFGSHIPPEDMRALDTFTPVNWQPENYFGNTTTIEPTAVYSRRSSRARWSEVKLSQKRSSRHSRNESTEILFEPCQPGTITAETTVEVSREMMKVPRLPVQVEELNEDMSCIKGEIHIDASTDVHEPK